MPTFSKQSQARLATCDERLQVVLSEAIKHVDFTVLCGHRGKAEQEKAVSDGASKTPWPTSKHNRQPSLAVDVAPYPIDWSNKHKVLARFYYLAGVIKAVAAAKGVNLRWGGDWDGDIDFADQNFDDLPHFEVVG